MPNRGSYRRVVSDQCLTASGSAKERSWNCKDLATMCGGEDVYRVIFHAAPVVAVTRLSQPASNRPCDGSMLTRDA